MNHFQKEISTSSLYSLLRSSGHAHGHEQKTRFVILRKSFLFSFHNYAVACSFIRPRVYSINFVLIVGVLSTADVPTQVRLSAELLRAANTKKATAAPGDVACPGSCHGRRR